MLFRIVILVLCLTVGERIRALDLYYNAPGGRVDLRIDSSKVLIKLEGELSPNSAGTVLRSVGRSAGVMSPTAPPRDSFVVCSLKVTTNYQIFIDSLRSVPGVALVEPYFVSSKGIPLYVGNAFWAAFEEGVSRAVVDSINAFFRVAMGYEVPGMPGVYLLRNTKYTNRHLLDIANTYHDLSNTRYAAPTFGIRPRLNNYKLYDYYSYAQLKHLKKVIGQFNVATAWDFHGVLSPNRHAVVAVIDDGIVRNHEDLPASRILTGWDFGDHDSMPIELPADGHGMGRAGIIAASNTTDSISGLSQSSGVFSLNPQAHILPIKIKDTLGLFIDLEGLVASIGYASGVGGAEVLANSWTFDTDPQAQDQTLNDAFYLAFTQG